KILGEYPEMKTKIKDLMPEIKKAVSEVNKLSVKKQGSELLKIDKHALDKREERHELPEIKGIKIGKCSFRLPPGPEKELHIGHALSYLLNNYYAKKYKGKLILRFEDTNPEKCEQRFVNGNKEDLKSLGITWDEEYYLSDNLAEYYNLCEKLLKSGDAYSCNCPSEKMSNNRKKRIRCPCADKKLNNNLRDWNKMKYGTYHEGVCVIRLKADMKSKNSVMWDPVIFRINKAKHYRQGTQFNVWPLYDFTAAIEDAKITHVLRDANWTQRIELQDFIRKKLGFRNNPVNILYSRYQVEGGVTQGRTIRELVENKTVEGYDDIRLATVKGLLRKGFLPETFMELLKEAGITKSKTTIPLEKLNTINRRMLDKKVNHYFFVENPVLLLVAKAPEKIVKIPLNPYTNKAREVKVNGKFHISRSDVVKGLIRLKHAYNVKIMKTGGDEAIGEYVEENIIKNVPIIQWVKGDEGVNVIVREALPLFDNKGNLNKESIIEHRGMAENAVLDLPIGSQIQFERFGFVKKEANSWILTHN
ncbi:hypothetical protein COS83_02935, partial [archaeon CG07_land_8_20_14_0_80_38_8]